MCGLFGWVRQEGSKHHRDKAWTLSQALALFNDDRGGDSWGFMGDSLDRPVKGLGDAFSMREKTGRCMATRRWLIGHTRKATTGKVVPENSHPFLCGSVYGAHNGMVTNHGELNVLYDRDCEVDSMHIFHHIDDGRESFKDIESYGAITFTTQQDKGEVYLGRFNSGELAVYDVPGFGLVWSSAKAHLKAALRTAALKGRPVELEEGKTYVATPRGLQKCSLELDFDDPWYRWKKSDLMSQTGGYSWSRNTTCQTTSVTTTSGGAELELKCCECRDVMEDYQYDVCDECYSCVCYMCCGSHDCMGRKHRLPVK